MRKASLQRENGVRIKAFSVKETFCGEHVGVCSLLHLQLRRPKWYLTDTQEPVAG